MRLENGVVADATQGGHIQGPPNIRSSAFRFAIAALLAAVGVHGGYSNQGGDLLAIEVPQFRQVCQQGSY
jgi:hypothetical protein